MDLAGIIAYFIVFCMLIGLIQILSLRGKRSIEKMKEAMRANPPESFGTATKNGTPVGGEIFRQGDWLVTSAKGENLPDSSSFFMEELGRRAFLRPGLYEPIDKNPLPTCNISVQSHSFHGLGLGWKNVYGPHSSRKRPRVRLKDRTSLRAHDSGIWVRVSG